MKKNISINISGIIFHIEEDGYETLKKYLDSINKYFSSFDDSSEILADIESRIAEILLSKLNEGKQVITLEDVNALTTTMGSVSDFKAAEERETPHEDTQRTSSGYQNSEQARSAYAPPKRFLRDQKRKILGGVSAGLANYFDIDPVWIRLLFFIGASSGVIFIGYIVMWIVVPGSYNLEEPRVDKKMFRDPERKVLGGVASGISAFFAIDIVIVRVLFIILSFFGFLGVIIYVVLWIILPEAKTITDRIQMEGEPVTLSTIESSIKKNLNEKESGEESALAKIILFPFRILALLITALGKIITPIIHVIRVGIGLLLTFLGIALLLSTVVTAGMLLGFFTLHPSWINSEEIRVPLEAFKHLAPTWTVVGAFLTLLMPCMLLLLLGTSIIAQRLTFGAATGWTLFVLFFVGIALLGASMPRILYSFREHGEYKIEKTYNLAGKTAVLKTNDTDIDGFHYYATSLRLRGYEGKGLKLVEIFKARGSSPSKARENAQMVDYTVDVQDSIFTFDTAIRFREDSRFHAQHLSMLLYIPYDQPFVMEEGMSRLLSHRHHTKYDHTSGYTWSMTEDGMKCLNCPDKSEYGWDDDNSDWGDNDNNTWEGEDDDDSEDQDENEDNDDDDDDNS